ncbi:MAG: thioesterase family protein [Chitinophagaceae bacterium]
MARIKIILPGSFHFKCPIPVRITDLNYGGHVGNDTVLSIIHEARMQFFKSFGYTEMNFAGAGMIMADTAIEFKSELFYGDKVIASVAAAEFSKIGFDLFYKLEKQAGDNTILVAVAKTGMICYDYEKKKIIGVPEGAKEKLTGK